MAHPREERGFERERSSRSSDERRREEREGRRGMRGWGEDETSYGRRHGYDEGEERGFGESRESGRGYGESGYGGWGEGRFAGGQSESGYGGFGEGERGRHGFGEGWDYGRDDERGFGGAETFGAGMPRYRYTELWLIRGPHTGRGPKNYRRSDERLVEEVCQRLEQDGEVDASEIEVSAENGVVTLKGKVDDRRTKRRAEDVAAQVYGVSDVMNRIQVDKGFFARLFGGGEAEEEDEAGRRARGRRSGRSGREG